MPLFSVIIPTYNRELFLKETLQSVFRQTFPDFEVIVVDDGSTDNTWTYLQNLKHKIIFLRQKNKGPGAARNLGALHASGKYLAFLDSDDLWFPYTLEKLYPLLNLPEKISLVHLPVEHFDRNEMFHEFESNYPTIYEKYKCFIDAVPKIIQIGSGHLVVCRNTFIYHGGFVENINCAEDHDLVLRLSLETGFIRIKSPPFVACRIHEQKQTRSSKNLANGILFIIDREKKGLYPGGKLHQKQRRHIITTHARAASLMCLRNLDLIPSLHIYFKTFFWQARHLRYRYLFGYVLYFLLCFLRLISIHIKKLFLKFFVKNDS
ncbi:MAG: glycosyltransferase [Methylacidiphilales bacterium]|nr:glycosyltransferase [Candidatus Methylacidiphilales bacterium]